MNKKTEVLQIRLTPKEKNQIRMLAKVYADGDVSTWIRWAAINAERKFIKKDSINKVFRSK
jgi:hypothetical protein